jgi:hypothetical protein
MSVLSLLLPSPFNNPTEMDSRQFLRDNPAHLDNQRIPEGGPFPSTYPPTPNTQPVEGYGSIQVQAFDRPNYQLPPTFSCPGNNLGTRHHPPEYANHPVR